MGDPTTGDGRGPPIGAGRAASGVRNRNPSLHRDRSGARGDFLRARLQFVVPLSPPQRLEPPAGLLGRPRTEV